MKYCYHLCTMILLVLISFLLIVHSIRRNDEALASRIAPEVLRFHVLANSNSPEDQAVKLKVKDFLLETIRQELNSSNTLITKDMVEDYILDNKLKLEMLTELYIEEMGFSYPAEIRLESCQFPQKTYGDMTFPAGTYQAVRVLIGAGAGENFWCVLYPSLCYLDSTYAVVPDSSREHLQAVLPEDDFQSLISARHKASIRNPEKKEQDSLLPRIIFRLKFVEFLKTDL